MESCVKPFYVTRSAKSDDVFVPISVFVGVRNLSNILTSLTLYIYPLFSIKPAALLTAYQPQGPKVRKYIIVVGGPVHVFQTLATCRSCLKMKWQNTHKHKPSQTWNGYSGLLSKRKTWRASRHECSLDSRLGFSFYPSANRLLLIVLVLHNLITKHK